MQETDREQRPDDERATPPDGDPARPPQSPVIRSLANPRRVRRA